MYNKNIPADRELPSTRKLVKSTILAATTALILLVTVVMPAEYGIDPTGVGNALGLKRMGEIKVSLAQEAAAEINIAQSNQAIAVETTLARFVKEEDTVASATPVTQAEPTAPATNMRNDEMALTLAPNEGAEIKVELAKGKKVGYSWATNGGRANFDVHADSKALGIKYHGYEKGSEQTKEGIIEAAFDGSHGWFWRNRTSETLTLIIKTSGEYTSIKRME